MNPPKAVRVKVASGEQCNETQALVNLVHLIHSQQPHPMAGS